MLFTKTPNRSDQSFSIARTPVSIFSAPQPQPQRLTLPANCIPQPLPDAFNAKHLVVIGEEFEKCNSAGRAGDTPVYRILGECGKAGPESSQRCYRLQNVWTEEVREGTYERKLLRLLKGQKVEGLEGEGEGEGDGGKGPLGGKKGGDAETLVGDGGDGRVASRDDETLRGDDDEGEREALGRGR